MTKIKAINNRLIVSIMVISIFGININSSDAKAGREVVYNSLKKICSKLSGSFDSREDGPQRNPYFQCTIKPPVVTSDKDRNDWNAGCKSGGGDYRAVDMHVYQELSCYISK